VNVDDPTYPAGPQPLDDLDGWYLDSDGSLLCEECASESNNLDEVPQFRPVAPVRDLTDEDYCDDCSRQPERHKVSCL